MKLVWLWAYDDIGVGDPDDDMPMPTLTEQRRWHICTLETHLPRVPHRAAYVASLCGLTYTAPESAWAPKFAAWLMRRMWFRGQVETIDDLGPLGPMVVCGDCVSSWRIRYIHATPR